MNKQNAIIVLLATISIQLACLCFIIGAILSYLRGINALIARHLLTMEKPEWMRQVKAKLDTFSVPGGKEFYENSET